MERQARSESAPYLVFYVVALSDEEEDDELLLDDDDDEERLLDELLELLERDELLDEDRELEDDELLAADELLDDDELLAAGLEELDELVLMPVGEAGELPHPASPEAATAPVSRSRKSRRGRLESRSFPSSVVGSTGLLSGI